MVTKDELFTKKVKQPQKQDRYNSFDEEIAIRKS